MCRIAMISAHGSPLAQPGERETGGMNVYIRELSRELGRRGMVVDVFIRRTDPEAPDVEEFDEQARIVRVKAGECGPMDKVRVFDHLPEFVCNVLRFAQATGLEYQYIHSHYWLSGWIGSLLSWRWSLPFVAMFHTLARVKLRAMPDSAESQRRIDVERRIVRTADALVAATEHERDAMMELYGAQWEQIAVVPCGVDLARFRPFDRGTARAFAGLHPDDEVVLFAGRMDPVKGLDVLVRAIALLPHRPRLRLLIAGGADDDVELQRTQRLATHLGIAGRLTFLGAVSQDLLPRYYSAADVCVMPSAYESFGLVAVESLACGTPVIASMVGGLPSIVHEGENGLLVPWRVPAAFARRLDDYLGDPALRRRLRSHARESVARYHWGSIAESIIALYHQLGAVAQPQQVCLCPH
ncbi:MAG: glycosyltransferase [Chloroflexi bacterium]|nr:glycosyltransferase [Chloroflexota bacterium]